MPDRLCADWLDSYIESTSNSEPPELFRIWGGIAALSSVLQRRCKLSWGDVSLYPNFYIVLIGSPASRKSTALAQSRKMVEETGITISADATTREALIKRLRESSAVVDAPYGRSQTHCSMSVYSSEFIVFIGRNNGDFIDTLCDWYDSPAKWVYDTKTQGKDDITGLFITIIGAGTPEVIASNLPVDSISGGFTSRVIFVVNDKPIKRISMPKTSQAHLDMQANLKVDLERISLLTGEFTWTEGYFAFYDDWYSGMDERPPVFQDSRFHAYIARRQVHFHKLAMICCVSESNSMLITSAHGERALAILRHAEESMTGVYSKMSGSNPTGLILQKVIDYLNDNGGEVPVHVILSVFFNDIDELELMNLIGAMETMGVVKIIRNGNAKPILRALTTDAEMNKGL